MTNFVHPMQNSEICKEDTYSIFYRPWCGVADIKAEQRENTTETQLVIQPIQIFH